MTKVRIGENTYPASLTGTVKDGKWGGRESISILLTMRAVQTTALFTDNVQWFVQEETEDANSEWDYSAYCMAGDVTDHRDGTVTVKMGKKTELETANETAAELDEALEQAYELLYGGEQV